MTPSPEARPYLVLMGVTFGVVVLSAVACIALVTVLDSEAANAWLIVANAVVDVAVLIWSFVRAVRLGSSAVGESSDAPGSGGAGGGGGSHPPGWSWSPVASAPKQELPLAPDKSHGTGGDVEAPLAGTRAGDGIGGNRGVSLAPGVSPAASTNYLPSTWGAFYGYGPALQITQEAAKSQWLSPPPQPSTEADGGLFRSDESLAPKTTRLAVHWHWPITHRCFFPFGWLCRIVGHTPYVSRLAIAFCHRCGDLEVLPFANKGAK